MKERPILFSAPMVRAILDGRKTQTRRILKSAHNIVELASVESWSEALAENCAGVTNEDIKRKADQLRGKVHPVVLDTGAMVCFPCPYGRPGDRLWVREKFSRHLIPDGEPYFYPEDRLRQCVDHDYGFHYWADGDPEYGDWEKPRPSIHMPMVASRITLEVTAVRVERLQEISDRGASNDCTAEGVFHCGMEFPGYEKWHGAGFRSSEKFMFKELWEFISGPGSWDANPWVWCVEFKSARP